MKERQHLGKWELGCLVFHACFYKIFTTYPKQFGEISGTAAWITALYTGLLFLAGLWVILWFLERYRPWLTWGSNRVFRIIGRGLLAAYWAFAAIWALREYTAVLQEEAYLRSPGWFLMGFFLLGAGTAVFCGSKAVYRMHSLTVLGIGIAMAVVAILGLKYAEPGYLAPWLGTGTERIFGDGLSTLFLYTDILLIFQLIPRCRPEVKSTRTVMTGASLAVLWNLLLILVSSMSHSPELNNISDNLIYPLTKAAYFGKFWSRLDAVYLIALMTSGMLYLSMAFHLLKLAIGKIKVKTPGRKKAALLLCFLLVFSLTGCYDGREVEESAYTVALGIDRGEEKAYTYTFQLSNPLELGGNIEMEKKEAGKEEEESAEENKTVTNITIEAEDFYLAVNRLKSHLSKEPDFSHLKVIVFSKEVAEGDILENASLLFREQEIRPSTNVCLAESAREFLTQVKPTLERSTARYYELLFQNRNTPYAPVVELREFVSRGTDIGWDPVMPVADKEKLMGMGIFQDGTLVRELAGEKALLYQFLSGQAREIAVTAGESSFSVTSPHRPQIFVDRDLGNPKVTVGVPLEADLIYGSEEDISYLMARLEGEMTDFLRETMMESCDVLGVGNVARQTMLTQEEWEQAGWREKLSQFDIFIQTSIKI